MWIFYNAQQTLGLKLTRSEHSSIFKQERIASQTGRIRLIQKHLQLLDENI